MRMAKIALCTLALLGAAVVAAPALASGETPVAPGATAAAIEADPCGPAPLYRLLAAPPNFTPAPAAPSWSLDGLELARPPFRKTCRCSCGYPCVTNEDCGPGGYCTAGITCCAAPGRGRQTLPAAEEPESPPIANGAIG